MNERERAQIRLLDLALAHVHWSYPAGRVVVPIEKFSGRRAPRRHVWMNNLPPGIWRAPWKQVRAAIRAA